VKIRLKYQTLIELFNHSTARVELADKQYLEVVRTGREEKLTFGQLRSKAREFAAHLLQDRGIRKGARVAILGKNRADWDVAFWGVILTGAVPVLIDPERPLEGVKRHLLYTDTRLLVMADDYQDKGTQEALKGFLSSRGINVIEMTIYEKPSLDNIRIAALLSNIRTEIDADDTAVILCTSGTTGDPREVEITHTNLVANIQGTLDAVLVTAADKLGHIIPPHHSFGLTVAKLLPLWAGATWVYTDRYRLIPELIRDKGITIFVGVPALFSSFAKKIEAKLAEQKEKSRLVRLADRYLPKLVGRMIVKSLGWENLRFFVSGAAPVPKWVLEVFWKRGLPLCEGYGTTENSPVYGFNSNPKKLGSVGKPIPTLSVKIVNERNQTLKPGQKGQIVLGGPCIVKGYYKNPRAVRAAIRKDKDGVRWLHTGDWGWLDEDGYLFITGRRKYLIVLPGGKNVHPELVELALSQSQYVQELIVMSGRQKDGAGIEQEAVKAIVRPAWEQIQADTNLSRRDLLDKPKVLKSLIWQSINRFQQKSQELAPFEKIRSKDRLEIRIDEFEKTSTGKIKRGIYTEAGQVRG